MTSFFIYRNCDISGTAAQRAIQRNQDVLNRGLALIEGDSGVPDDDTDGSDNPTLPIVSAAWGDLQDGDGQLPPGTYDYKIIPINTCTGRTGKAQSLPSLTIPSMGKVATLRVKLASKPPDCNGVLIQRNGKVVGPTFPMTNNVLDNVPVVTSPDSNGTYNNGTNNTFDRVSGADLQVGDLVLYRGSAVKVMDVTGPTVTFEPPLVATPPPAPAGFFDLGARTGIYFNDVTGVPLPLMMFSALPGLPFPTPWMAFKAVPIPGLLAMPQVGDLILYGSKTAIVVVTEPELLPIPALKVGVIPFGLLPIPPLPAGLFHLIARPLSGFLPSVGLYFNLDSPAYGAPGSSAYDKFEVLGDVFNGGAPIDTNIVVGSYLGVNGQFVRITAVENGTNISGGTDLTKARVTVSPSWSTDVQVKFPSPAPGTPFNQAGVIGGYGVPTGPYVALPASLAGMFLIDHVPAPTGSYTRLTRLISITTENDIFQWQETGEHQDRSGTVDGTAVKEAINNLFTQNNYPGGLQGLLDKLRGSTATTPSSVFVKTNGDLTQIGQRLIAVNRLASKGSGTLISLSRLREFRSRLCGTWANVKAMNAELLSQGFSVARFESREVFLPPAACPPGQPDAREVQLFCTGLATPQNKVKAGEQVRVFWANGATQQPGVKRKLIALGLTSAEAESAATLQVSGRILSVMELTLTETSDITDVGALGSDADIDDVLDDTRIIDINTGPITRPQIGEIIRRRGRRGIVSRPPGTNPNTAAQAGFEPIDDFSLPMHNLAALALSLQLSFDICDFDAALASLPEGELRTALAAFFAVIEAALNGLVTIGHGISNFLSDGPFGQAIDAVAALISAISSDPTLGCLVGPIGASGSGISNIPAIDSLLQGLSFPFTVRFDLSSLLAQAVGAVLCSVIGALVDLIGQFGGADAAAFTKRAIGCLPSVEDLSLAGIEFPSLDVQVALECSLDQLQLLQDIIQELIAEANEIIDLINSLDSGFVLRAVEARNNACSSGQDLTSLVAGIASLGTGAL